MDKKHTQHGKRAAYELLTDPETGELTAKPAEGIDASIFPPKGSLPEPEAIEQLLKFGRVKSMSGRSALALAGMSDLHPNHPIPVGAALATPVDMAVPSAIGNDINCGMRLVKFDLPVEVDAGSLAKIRAALRGPLVEARRDIPLEGRHFRTLFEDGPEAMGALGLPALGLWRGMDPSAIAQAASCSPALDQMRGSCLRMPESMMQDRMIREPGLGTLGSGNHFFELQALDERLDRHASYAMGLDAGPRVLYGLIHTGSRDVGQWVGSSHAQWAREAWAKQKMSAPEGIFVIEGDEARAYLGAQWAAARYAWLNRMALQEMARQALGAALGSEIRATAIADCSHNVALVEDGRLIHRKGACRACAGEAALIPGSMGDYSFVARGLGLERALSSCPHGAGRSKRRSVGSHSEGVSKLPFVAETPGGRRVSEEAPWCYMDVEKGVEAMSEAGAIELVARMRPLATFKA